LRPTAAAGGDIVEASFLLAGISVLVLAEDKEVAELVDSRLRTLRSDPVSHPDVVVEIRGPGADRAWPPRPVSTGRPIYDAPAGPIDYFAEADALFVDYEHRVRMLCAPARGVIQLAICGSDSGDPVLATHPLLSLALLETMKRFERFPLHAAGLSLDGHGVLVAGTSGAGKSTLSVTLARAGFDFLSDDTVFLGATDDGLVMSGFPDEVDVTEATISMFPELGHLTDRSLRPGRDKHGFRVEDVLGITPLEACRPAAVLAPRVEPGSVPRLEKLSSSEALFELMPNILLTDPEATQSHLGVLAELVRTVPCFSFRLGEDCDAAAACVTELVTR
jgi:hypothetical protein